MTPEIWEKVRQLYDVLVDLQPKDRDGYLKQICGSNESLRREVESVLAADRQAEDFLEAGALDDAAKALAQEQANSLINQQLGRYRVLELIGVGAMGEVYRASDPRLGRDVAIKILPAPFAADANRVRRLAQEAQAIAALNHPNILSIYDVGDNERAPYIVAELLEGEDLRRQLIEGAIPLQKTINYAQQVARGLAAAHQRGIVHRDLKPENLFVTKDGCVKILDFGLAKLRQSAGDALQDGGTVPGTVLGTVAYMSPEQVRGEEADHRADVFAFGVILYEMLSGRRPFIGASAVEVMNAILKEEPPGLDDANTRIPPQLSRIVLRCLEKTKERRFQSASDLEFHLETLSEPLKRGAVAGTRGIRSRQRYTWPAAITACVFAMLWFVASPVLHVREQAAATKFQVALPEQLTIVPAQELAGLSVAPNGCCLAFVATVEGHRSLWLRRLDRVASEPLPDTAGAFSPFWSPDSRFIAFFANGALKKIAASGGSPQRICDLPTNPSSGAWGSAGVILIGGNSQDFKGIYRVAENGGVVTPLVKLEQMTGYWPSFLPDGQHFLYFSQGNEKQRGIYAGSIGSAESRLLLPGNSRGEYASPGYLLFVREGSLAAQPFDAAQMRLSGSPVDIAEQVGSFSPTGWAEFSAGGGTLAWYSYPPTSFTWFDRGGRQSATTVTPGSYDTHRLAPDGQRVAFSWIDSHTGHGDLWLSEFARKGVTRVTEDTADHGDPVWSPDGHRLAFFAFSGIRKPTLTLMSLNDPAKQEQPLGPGHQVPTDWSSDGHYIAYTEEFPDSLTGQNIWFLPLTGDRKPVSFLRTRFNESHARFSPDRRWVTYVSDESGKPEVYVRAFDGSGEKIRISTEGGTRAAWRRDGSELFYLSGDNQLTAVPVRTGARFLPGPPVSLFRITSPGWNVYGNAFEAAPDGQRFLIQTAVPGAQSLPFTIVGNWTAELKR